MPLKENCHPLFPYSNEEKMAVWQELGLKQSVIEEDVDMILEWFQKQPHLIPAGLPDRDFVERMLIAAKGSREKTKRRLDGFYRHRAMAPELVQNRAEHIETTNLWPFYVQATIPKLFNLKRVTVLYFTDPDPNNFDMGILLKNSILLGDIRMKYDYMLGDIWVLDLKNTSLGHLLRINPVLLSKAVKIFSGGLGIRLFACHVLGAPSFAAQLQQFFSKFVPKLMERTIFHDTVEDLYKYIPKEYLPKEYGGEQPSLKFATEKYMSVFSTEETKSFLEECSKQISDESRRPGALITEDLQGTFKTLDLD